MNIPNRVIPLDVDGTLIDRTYEPTIPIERVRDVIPRVQSRDTLVGLNSDTPLLPLRSKAIDLGLRGPLIGEKGQVMAISPNEKAMLLGTMSDFFQQLKLKVVFAAHEDIEETFVGIGDVTEFLRRGAQVHGLDRGAVLINGYRQCSFSGYALSRHGNELVRDAEIFNHFCDLVCSIVHNDMDRLQEADQNQEHGILILHEKGASKTTAIERLFELMGTDAEYVMIGDGDSDIIQTSHPVKLCAVGNASPQLKEKARETGGIVANETFTKGVLEILTCLDQ